MAATVLIIEDNPQNLYLMRFLLVQAGLEVTSAGTGPEGVAMAVALKPALILLDIRLPDADGFALAKELRRCPGLVGIPIVVVTSYAMAGDRERAMLAGATDYIEKPIDPESFVQQVTQWVSQ